MNKFFMTFLFVLALSMPILADGETTMGGGRICTPEPGVECPVPLGDGTQGSNLATSSTTQEDETSSQSSDPNAIDGFLGYIGSFFG